jgi:CHAT domain-containing protein
MVSISTQIVGWRSMVAIVSCSALLWAMPSYAESEAINPTKPPAEIGGKAETALPEYLENLRTAKNPGYGPIGAAAVPSQLYKDFQRAIQDGDRIGPEIEYMLQSGTPVGKVYAAALLMQFDLEAARPLLESMGSNQTPIAISPLDYATDHPTTVGQWATRILQGNTKFLPQALPFAAYLAPPHRNPRALQRSLVAEKRFEQALEVAEQTLNHEFLKVWATYTTGNTQAALQKRIAQPPNLEEIRAIAKAQRATLVEYSIVSDDLLYIWVIKPEGTIAFKSVALDKSNPIPRIVMGLKNSSFNRQSALAQQLHQLLIEPIAQDLPTDPNDRIIFIPGAQLASLPFAALKTGQGQYLIEKHTISTAPSIQALNQSHRQKPSSEPLIVGNPTNAAYRNEELAPLPGSEKEAKAIAAIMGVKALLGPQATKQAVLERLSTSNIIHLATNGFADFGDPRLPGSIILGPSQNDLGGLLTATEIAQLSLNSDLVVLSTGNVGQRVPQAFLIAGASTVVMPLWDTDDESAAVFMPEFYRQLKANPNKAAALRQAMLMRLKAQPEELDWAAFTLFMLD